MLVLESIQALDLAVFNAEDVTVKDLNSAASLFNFLDKGLFDIMRSALAGIANSFSHASFHGSYLKSGIYVSKLKAKISFEIHLVLGEPFKLIVKCLFLSLEHCSEFIFHDLDFLVDYSLTFCLVLREFRIKHASLQVDTHPSQYQFTVISVMLKSQNEMRDHLGGLKELLGPF